MISYESSLLEKSKSPEGLFTARKAKMLIPLLEEAYSYKYDERPNYGKLRFLLESILLNNETLPDKQYSWIRNQ